MTDISKYDAVLVYDANDFITEASFAGSAGDTRGSKVVGSGPGLTMAKDVHFYYDDPALYASNAFGKMMASELNSWRSGYSAKVSDFGKWVIVEVTNHNHITGRSASKTFLVVFNADVKGADKSTGIVLTTANKYRTISGYGQAVNYIKSISTSLESTTSQKL